MASTVKAITAVSLETLESLSNYENWTAFLSSAAWQFKYSFADQVLIYAQRPHAKACGTFEFWHENKKWYRWIRKGVEGIALLRETDNGYKLEYVYDVSDTRSMDGKRFYLWQYDSRFEGAVIETLENTFGELKSKTTIEDAIIEAAKIAVEDSKTDYLAEMKYAKENSFMEDLDEFNIDVEFQRVAEASVAFMIMQRLNLKPQEIFEREDFQAIADFNTPETISVLGNAVSSIADQAIREISKTIIAERIKLRQQAKFFANENNPVYNNDKQEELNDNKNMERNDESVSTDNLHSDRRKKKKNILHTINHYDSNAHQEKEPTIREIFDEYAPLIVSKVLNDEAYVNACYNSDEQNAKLECDEAVKRAVMSLPFEENASLHKLYYDMAEFHRRLETHAFEKTYELILYEKDLPVYDRETEIIGDILSAIGRNDVQMEFDDNGIVGVAPDKRMAGQEFYQFLINEVLLDIGGLNLFKLTDKNLNDFRDLMFHHGMEDAYNKAIEIRIPKEIRDIGKPQTAPEKPQSNTYEHRNYLLLKKLAPEILSKESSYIHFVAGSAIMPLTVEHLSGNRIAVSHYYKQDSDSIADPDMEFIFDNENETLTAMSFQQGSFYQTTETPNGINKTLERELNSFANQWFRNNDSYGFVKEVQKVKWQDEEIELTFNKNGDITSIVGTQETVSDYVETHNLDLVQISADTYGILAPSAPEEEQAY